MFRATHKTNPQLTFEVSNDQKAKIEKGKYTKGLYNFVELPSKKGKSSKPNISPSNDDVDKEENN